MLRFFQILRFFFLCRQVVQKAALKQNSKHLRFWYENCGAFWLEKPHNNRLVKAVCGCCWADSKGGLQCAISSLCRLYVVSEELKSQNASMFCVHSRTNKFKINHEMVRAANLGVILHDQFSINRTKIVWDIFWSWVLCFLVTTKAFQCKFIASNSRMSGCTVNNVTSSYFFQI